MKVAIGLFCFIGTFLMYTKGAIPQMILLGIAGLGVTGSELKS